MLTAGQIDTFYREGYLEIPGLFSRVEVQQIRAAFSRLRDLAYRLKRTQIYRNTQFVLGSMPDARDGIATAIQRVVWCGGAEPVLLQLGRASAVLHAAAAILGSAEIVHLINQAHFKLPGDGVAFDWHQDCLHRRYGTDLWTDVNGRGSFVQVCTAVDPMTEENGPIKIIPRSCALGPLPVEPETRGLLPGSFDPGEARSLHLEPGAAVLIGPYTIHGSEPNQSTTSRRLFVNGFCSPGANRRVYPGSGLGETLDTVI